MLVHKFGGTSVETGERLRAAAEIVASHQRPAVVVTSALAGVTDALIALARLAQRGEVEEVKQQHEALEQRHHEAAAEVTSDVHARVGLTEEVTALFEELAQLLHGVALLHELSPRTLDLVMSFGERLAAPLLAAAIRDRGVESRAVDARTLVRTDGQFGRALVDLDQSRALVEEALAPLAREQIPVVTGFIAQSADGVTTTLGRGGSDYTAALLGAFLKASEIWIWTDVVGVMTADPRVVPEAEVLPRVSYREAAEMAYFGSKVVHPSTMTPAVHAGIPIRIKSSLEPDQPGTAITEESGPGRSGVKTVTSISDMALVTVEGRGMMGVPGVGARVFSATAAAGVNVYMISQASSEQNITFLVRRENGPNVQAALQSEFELELARRRIDRIDLRSPVGVVAIIGEGMRGLPGISQRLFSALGKARINVEAIAQGSSELNVSVVVDQQDLHRAVGATHSGFGLTRTTHVFLLGKGLIGRTLLAQLLASRQRLREEHELGINVVGVAGQKAWVFDPHGLPDHLLGRIAAGKPLGELGAKARPDDASMVRRIARTKLLDVVFVDVTAGDTGELHLEALRHGLHLVTANKRPLAGALEQYRALRREALDQGVGYHFETTFGAGLPVLYTLQDLLATRDRVKRVTGCFSGTLGFICTGLQEGRPLSALVAEARELGFTEPDPREDLSGRDVARKALIIARELGADMEMADVSCSGLLPEEVAGDLDVEAFMAALPALDGQMAERVQAARDQGQVLRYVADITPDEVRVELRAVDLQSAVGQLSGPDNLLVYQTERYDDHPLVIRGPGAGAEVTAAGVFGDILKVARRG